jgi:hypothetical protein
MEVTTAKQVRFGKLVEAGGKPEAYLPFSDPETDKAFMRAVKEERVVTLKQDPTSKRKDFGIVGYLKEKYATYLLFPKSLRAFSGQRVIGIDYGVLQAADVHIGGDVSAIPKRPKPKKAKAAPVEARREKPAPKPKEEKPKPEPKNFTVEVRLTTTEEKQIKVTAWNHREAKEKAIAEIERASNFDKAQTTIKVARVLPRN